MKRTAPIDEPAAQVVALAAQPQALGQRVLTLAQARAFAEPLLAPQSLDSGENALSHAEGMAEILREMGGDEGLQACPYLVYAGEHLQRAQETLAKAFGPDFARLAQSVSQLNHLQRQARASDHAYGAAGARSRAENVRRMLLAFSRDLRVVLVRLASRLQTLRHHAQTRTDPGAALAQETLQVFAPLANRLGIWQIKWELEDLAFRFLEPDTYRQVARWLDEKRTEREQYMHELRTRLQQAMAGQGIAADVQGRPKHIYSIVKKMRGKSLGFERIFDIRALRVVVESVPQCYAVLGWVHEHFQPVVEEFDDYIARPKANGYQSLHTVVRDAQGRAIEVQIRTRAMHELAETGVAAHWAYKEAGTKGYAGVSASSDYDAKIAVLRQLLAWQKDLSATDAGASQGVDVSNVELDDRIYVLTPDAAIVDLPAGSTAVDFAYSVHTDLGHRCRGARVDGAMVPLTTPLQNGQTIEIVAVKEGGPSRDWLNPELGFLASPRARNKVRAWFNAQATRETIARGREMVERLLQREGKTAVKLEDLASQLGFKSADDLFEVVGKDEFSLRAIEAVLRPAAPQVEPDELVRQRIARQTAPANPAQSRSGVLVVGVDSLLTQLARCCKPAPPDAIRGFVTRGKGVSIHRLGCPSLAQLLLREPGRDIEVEWGKQRPGDERMYPVDVQVIALDRPTLLRDISEIFAREKMPVTGVQSQVIKGQALMSFTVQTPDTARLSKVLLSVAEVKGVRTARRR
jgi:GTP pyrophosphokinase